MRKMILIGICLLLVGCAPRITSVYNANPNITQEQKMRDLKECEYEVEKATPQWNGDGSPLISGVIEGQRRNKLLIMCLESKGYIFDYEK